MSRSVDSARFTSPSRSCEAGETVSPSVPVPLPLSAVGASARPASIAPLAFAADRHLPGVRRPAREWLDPLQYPFQPDETAPAARVLLAGAGVTIVREPVRSAPARQLSVLALWRGLRTAARSGRHSVTAASARGQRNGWLYPGLLRNASASACWRWLPPRRGACSACHRGHPFLRWPISRATRSARRLIELAGGTDTLLRSCGSD